ncbi:MarR family transcriptional regulator [candidate division WOR_3 bacterium SM23_42]|uniref:MarR family transcriptional regulator n=1 Tax=candidate division WOR_3 bacterium SM23_42 TaxID=1703779 RepID=A0A0S8FWM2_UNCW3|nr:MAG: MarR family transcriptional regulator [candidate division WOR_3 bacterium SM23_42]
MKAQRKGGFLIAKIHQLTGRILSRKLKEHNIEINPAQGRIMFVLWRNDEIPINELAKQTALRKSTLTSMLDRLEASGYVMRIPCSDDRRIILLKRTKKDRIYEKRYVQVSQDMTEIFYKGFSKREIDLFEEYLRRLLYNLMKYEEHRNK